MGEREAAHVIAALFEKTAAPPPISSLPDKPLIVGEPSKSWAALNLRELWTSRELLYFLTSRDIKVRYKQTVLGATWVIFQPLLTNAGLYVLF